MSTKTIGKYGVGAKFAALNYSRRIDVWSRTQEQEPWLHVYFDLDEAFEQEENGQEVRITKPIEKAIPEELFPLLPKNKGTMVVWSKVDRLEDGRRAPDAETLRHEVEKDLSRMFRYFLYGGIKITVNETKLIAHDPLFLMEGTWSDQVLAKHYLRLSKTKDGNQPLIVEASKKTHFPARRIAKDSIEIDSSIATLTVTLYPKEVLRERYKGGDELAKKLRVPDNEGCISFVRMNREINYTLVPRIFPRGVENQDRFIGIEVSFTPEIDDYFGVRNVKRGVEPYDDLRKNIRQRLKKYIPEARKLLDEIWGNISRENQDHQGEHKPIIKEVKKADKVLPKSRVKNLCNDTEKERILDDLARDIVGKDDKKAQEEYKEKIKELPFVVETVDFPGSTFIDIQHINGQVIIRLNERHRFYREIWEPLRSIAQRSPGSVSGDEASQAARRTIEALSLLIIAYGKAESMDENPLERYGELRDYWGMFTDRLMGQVKDVL